MALTRLPYWDTRFLHSYLLAHANDPFKWGSHDCCLFAANAIQSFTNVDIASDFRGKYTTQLGALKLVKSVTSTGITPQDAVAYCAKKNDMAAYAYPLQAQRGDLVVITNGADVIGGIVDINGRHVISVSATGLVRLPITKIVKAWKV